MGSFSPLLLSDSSGSQDPVLKGHDFLVIFLVLKLPLSILL
jgi:hypothetical protein